MTVRERSALEDQPLATHGAGADRGPAPTVGDDERGGLLDNKVVVWAIRIAVFASLIIVWEWYGNRVSRALFAPPSAIVQSIKELYVDENVMLPAMWTSLASLLLGYGAAMLFGIALGVMMGRFRPIEWLVSPYLTFIFSIPYIAFIPLLITWFGIEWKLRAVLVFLATLFPVTINTLTGVKEVDEDLLDVASVNCASEVQVLRSVVLPASIPFIFTGAQVGLGLALVGVVVAEMTAAITGLGGLIILYSNFFRTADLFVPILTLMAVSVLLTQLMLWLEGRLMPWREQRRR